MAWRVDGLAGVAEGGHPGKARRLDPAAEAVRQTRLDEGDPHAPGDAATGGTGPLPLLRTELAKRGGKPPNGRSGARGSASAGAGNAPSSW